MIQISELLKIAYGVLETADEKGMIILRFLPSG